MKMLSACYVCCIYLNVLKITFIIEANTMNLDEAALIWIYIVCNSIIYYDVYYDVQYFGCLYNIKVNKR